MPVEWYAHTRRVEGEEEEEEEEGLYRSVLQSICIYGRHTHCGGATVASALYMAARSRDPPLTLLLLQLLEAMQDPAPGSRPIDSNAAAEWLKPLVRD